MSASRIQTLRDHINQRYVNSNPDAINESAQSIEAYIELITELEKFSRKLFSLSLHR